MSEDESGSGSRQEQEQPARISPDEQRGPDAPYHDPEGRNPYGVRIAPNRADDPYQDPEGRNPYDVRVAQNRGSRPAARAAQGVRPLRVVHVGQSLIGVGGIETCLRALIRYMGPGGARLVKCVVTSEGNYDPSAASDLGVPLEVGGAEAVRRAAREADVLLCWGPRELGEWLADCPPKLCVYVAHGEGFWTRWILEGCGPVVDHVIAVSQRVQEKVCYGFDSTVILNGVDAARLAPTRRPGAIRAELGFAPEDFVLGFAGRFAQEKRAHLVVEAVARLPRHFKALMVGAGYLRADLMDLANRLIPGRYAFATGFDDMGDYYRAMNALCMPSEEEGFGLVIPEAMLCERPVIATAVGCVPELLDDRVNGLVVEPTADAIRDAAERLASRPRWAAGLAAEAMATAQEVGYAAEMARRYEELLVRLWRQR